LNWLTGFIEYDYYGFSNGSPGVFACPAGTCGVGIVTIANTGIKTNANVLKVGLNFKFGG
jgi:hypothetical protein